jgi:hypothetical protein
MSFIHLKKYLNIESINHENVGLLVSEVFGNTYLSSFNESHFESIEKALGKKYEKKLSKFLN